MLRFLHRTAVSGLFTLLFVLPPISSAQIADVSGADLTRVSTEVVHARTTQVESYWSQDGRYILTDVSLQIQGSLKGNAPEAQVVTIPGGRVGSTAYEVSDMPVFVEGEEIVLFVWENASGQRTVTGGARGKLSVVTDRQTNQKMVLGAKELFKEKGAAKTEPGDEADDAARPPMSLDELRQRIEAIGN